MKKNKALSPVIATVILVCMGLTVAVAVAWLMGAMEQPVDIPEVNGEEIVQRKYYLGDLLYEDGSDYYYYHGVLDQWNSLNIVIGHYKVQYFNSGPTSGSNMYAEASAYRSFYIEGIRFRVIEYNAGEGWIILEG